MSAIQNSRVPSAFHVWARAFRASIGGQAGRSGHRYQVHLCRRSSRYVVLRLSLHSFVDFRSGMEYEGIYRKTGGSSQSKQITQLFERGDYDSFDLADVETFNDISSVTSVLKTYFRQLPNPLLTYALHESFVAAASESYAPIFLTSDRIM